jgi:uncharacterized OB-fold protein
MSEIKQNDEVLLPELFATDQAGRVRLVAGYYKESDSYTFPKYLVDPKTFSEDVEERFLSPTGILHSYTIVRRSLPEFPVPYALALVDFPEKVRVMAQVETDNFDELKIGNEMGVTVGTVRKTADGRDVKSYKFYAVKKRD